MKTKNNPSWLETMRAVQARWGIPRAEQVRAKSAGCLAFRGGRIYRDELVAWLKANPSAPGTGKDESLRARKMEKQIEKLEIEIEATRGRLISREVVREFCAGLVGDVFDILARYLDRDLFNTVSRELKIRIGTRAEAPAAHL
jgi:hypothetical protein